MERAKYGVFEVLVFPYYAKASCGLRLLNSKMATEKLT